MAGSALQGKKKLISETENVCQFFFLKKKKIVSNKFYKYFELLFNKLKFIKRKEKEYFFKFSEILLYSAIQNTVIVLHLMLMGRKKQFNQAQDSVNIYLIKCTE